ncbi:hypothetical protein [Prosthecobacter fluviatilis]|uniref:Uncharacterized protein n=1 Tax=Prosthecobacter fluviatilis TaxID=445931 RepID=A0ABW0KKS7_9BACT
MKLNPATLLIILLALGGAAALLLVGAGTEPPPADGQRTQVAVAKQEAAPVSASGSPLEDLKKQIVLLEGQVEYLQGQNDALKDENAQLIQKLGMLGMKDAPKMAQKADEEPPDFVGMGLEMMKMRKLQALPLVTTAVSQEEVEIVILAWLKRQQPNEEAKKFARGLAALGWIPEAIDPLPLRAALLARQLGGWYDDESETMYTIDPATASGPAVTSNEPLGIAFGQLLREYGDILYQPQHGAVKTDMRLARDSLIAGDAALTRFLHSLQNPASALKDDLPAEDPDHPLNQVPMPAFLRELALFPFSRGFDFAQTLHSAGNFAQLNAAYSRPPISTAEVIEPEVYLDPERPAPVEIKLDEVKLKGVLPYWDDCLGKFACVTVLRTYNEDEDAALGARGLVADRLLVWAADGGAKRDHAAWQTLFMDKSSADAFYKAMLSCLKQRYATQGENEFSAQGRFVCLLRNRGDAGVVLIEAASDEARAALKLLMK